MPFIDFDAQASGIKTRFDSPSNRIGWPQIHPFDYYIKRVNHAWSFIRVLKDHPSGRWENKQSHRCIFHRNNVDGLHLLVLAYGRHNWRGFGAVRWWEQFFVIKNDLARHDVLTPHTPIYGVNFNTGTVLPHKVFFHRAKIQCQSFRCLPHENELRQNKYMVMNVQDFRLLPR